MPACVIHKPNLGCFTHSTGKACRICCCCCYGAGRVGHAWGGRVPSRPTAQLSSDTHVLSLFHPPPLCTLQCAKRSVIQGPQNTQSRAGLQQGKAVSNCGCSVPLEPLLQRKIRWLSARSLSDLMPTCALHAFAAHVLPSPVLSARTAACIRLLGQIDLCWMFGQALRTSLASHTVTQVQAREALGVRHGWAGFSRFFCALGQ